MKHRSNSKTEEDLTQMNLLVSSIKLVVAILQTDLKDKVVEIKGKLIQSGGVENFTIFLKTFN